jgi:hypothetical protein
MLTSETIKGGAEVVVVVVVEVVAEGSPHLKYEHTSRFDSHFMGHLSGKDGWRQSSVT